MRNIVRIAGLTVAALLAVTALAFAATAGPKPSVYVGKTSQGQKFTLQFRRVSGREQYHVIASVSGSCPVTGLGNSKLTTNVNTGGFWTIRKGPWFAEDKAASYDIRVGGSYPGGTPKHLSGKLAASWKPNIDNVGVCQTGTLTWTARKK